MYHVNMRLASFEDAEAIYKLLCTIADLHREARPDMFPNLVSKYTVEQIKELLNKKNHAIFVAEYNDEVAGYVFCEIITEGVGATLYVDDLCVDAEARKMGIGKALMDMAVEYGRETGCRQLMLNVWEFNSGAISFYEKYGLTTRTRHMEMTL